MKFRTILMIVALALIAIFVAVNWAAFVVPIPLSLVVTSLQAPLGLIMLGMVVVLSAAFLVYIMAWQTSVLLETRRLNKHLESQRALAEQAETSRLSELRAYLQSELQQLQQRQNGHFSALTEKLESVQQDIEQRLQASENTLVAQLSELDDRWQRLGIGLKTV